MQVELLLRLAGGKTAVKLRAFCGVEDFHVTKRDEWVCDKARHGARKRGTSAVTQAVSKRCPHRLRLAEQIKAASAEFQAAATASVSLLWLLPPKSQFEKGTFNSNAGTMGSQYC